MNPPITWLLRAFTWIEVVVLLGAGGALFFVPDFARDVWPWSLTPFNTRFLGAIYLASFVGVAMLLRVGRWEPARIVVPLILTFTLVALTVSSLNVSRFEPLSVITAAWFLLYAALPVNCVYYLWSSRALRSANPVRMSAGWRWYLLAQGMVSAVYGVGLLMAPGPFSDFWPWKIDAFHGQMYSAAFLAPAVGSLILWRTASRMELITLGGLQITFGLLAILGLAIVDLSVHSVDWVAGGTLLWNGAFVVILVAGIAMIAQHAKVAGGPDSPLRPTPQEPAMREG